MRPLFWPLKSSHLLLDVPRSGDVSSQVEVGQRVEADGRAGLDLGPDDGDLLDQARDGGGLGRGKGGKGRGHGREGEGGEGAAFFFFLRERGREVIGVLSFFFLSRSLLDSVKERTSRLAKSCHSFLSSFPLAGTLMALHRLQRQAPH